MEELIFDLESDGLYFKATKIHSLVIDNHHSMMSCHNHGGAPTIDTAVSRLHKAKDEDAMLIGHNIINFDLPLIQKISPGFDYDIGKVRDTLLLSRLAYPNLADRDMGLIKARKLPPKLRGSHSLKAWGYRLGVYKGDFGEDTDWEEWSPAMQSYCDQDVTVTRKLWAKLSKLNLPERAVELEHWFAYIIAKQEKFGFRFDVAKAVDLYAELSMKRNEIDEELKTLIQPWYVSGGRFVPKRSNKSSGYIEGVPLTKVKLQDFNPGSRQQIANRLEVLYGWEPQLFTPSGQAQVDESVLSKLPYPPAKKLAERFMVEKRIGQIAEGKNGWLKLEREGRIHGSVNTIGAVTGRCTHATPNVAQVPSVSAPYGRVIRGLFHVDEGYVQIGADASGLELRCLAHYMARFDGGAYVKVLLEGDVHTANMEAAGLPERDMAKTFIYGFLYGAGDAKIGQIVGKGAGAGRKLKERFLNKTPALKRLREAVAERVNNGKPLKGIDGRLLHIRSEHAALNTLLQSAGALLVKQATINLYEELTRRGFKWGEHWAMVAHVHDEYQLQVLKGLEEEVAEVSVWAFQQAGEQFNWRCPLDGEAKIGSNWAECH